MVCVRDHHCGRGRYLMKKLWSKIKTFIKKHWIWCSIIFFAIGPLLLNLGLYLTDAIYDKFAYSLTARGLDNQDWLDFWGTYLSVLIAFVGICFAWKSSDEDRKKDKRERQAKEYGEHLEEEKHILTEVCQSFNTDVVYKSLLELNNMEVQGCKRVLQSARERVLNAQVEFELLTDIAEGFHNCENCNFNPCYDKENMTAIRELYYKMEGLYLELLQKCDTYLNSIVNTNRIEVQIRNNKNIISLLQQSIIYAREMSGTTAHDEIKSMEEKIADYTEQIKQTAQGKEHAEKWVALIRKYTDLTELTAPLLNELIEKIVVHEATKDERGKRTQEIDIYYRFIGKIDG